MDLHIDLNKKLLLVNGGCHQFKTIYIYGLGVSASFFVSVCYDNYGNALRLQ